MSGLGVICKELHWRHAAQGPGDGFCSLCVVETIERRDVSAARKRAALLEVARGNEARELLYRDKAGYLNFSRTLLRMLFSVGDSALLDQAVDVLLQMSVDLSSQEFRLFILDELRTQCADGVSLSSVLFLGKLLESHPPLSQALTSSHLCVLEGVCAGLRVCDEELKAAVCYALMMVWGSDAAVRTLPDPLRHCVCVLLLHTLTHAHTSALVHNALGVVKQMCQYPDCVCVLMNLKEQPKESFSFQTLPLIIKQLLLSSEDCVQTVCVQCVCAVMVHTPLMFSTSFLQADLPECVLECVCGGSEGLRWAGFTCLLQLCEDPMFFSQCHSVYGIEPLIRCVQETLGNSDIEVQKQGLTLLTTFLEKQPAAVRLFPTPGEFSTVANVVMKGVSTSCLQVSLCSVRTAAALLKTNHQSDPVQLSEVKSIIETVMSRFTELQSCSGSGRVLLRILSFFDTACSLLEMYVCASSTSVEKKTLESVCVYLLDCCDTVCIPAAVGVCERLSSVHLLQLFFSVMCRQFSLSPDHMTHFSRKLASCGFIKLAVESKARLCSGNRNINLNKVCCDFLLKMCAHLLPPETPELTGIMTYECEIYDYTTYSQQQNFTSELY